MSRTSRHLAPPPQAYAREWSCVLFNSHASPACPYEVLPLLRDSAALRNPNGLSACRCCNFRVAWRTKEGVPQAFDGGGRKFREDQPCYRNNGPNINGKAAAPRRWQAWPASHPRGHCLARFAREGCAKTQFIGVGFPRTAVQVFVPGFDVGFRLQF